MAFCYQPPRLGISSDLAADDADSNGTAQHSALLAKVYMFIYKYIHNILLASLMLINRR